MSSYVLSDRWTHLDHRFRPSAGRANDPVVASGATIGGERRRVQTNMNWEGFGWAGKLAWWLAVSVSTLVVGLLLAFFRLPILAIIALVTLVGIPLGLGLLAALGLIYALGYGATAWIVGRRILREPTAWILAFLVGWGILRSWPTSTCAACGLLRRFAPRGEFPHTVQLAAQPALISTYDQFQFGIRTFLAGRNAQQPTPTYST